MIRLRMLRRLAARTCLAAVCCAMSLTAFAQDFMNVSEVREGMTGYAKTVVHGNTIETFPVEILGVMKNSGPSGDLILAKFSGPLIEETGGIAQGMSGSPVYIDGKLVGAIAYGWSFTNSRVGMITPIGDMLKLWNVPTKEEIRPFNARESSLIPIATPLMVSGFDGVSTEWMTSKLPQYNFMPVNTASAAADEAPAPLEAGSSVAASLVNGDMKMGAIGTVTYVDGDNIVAFGHPFLKKGSMNYFMHNAYIFTIVMFFSSLCLLLSLVLFKTLLRTTYDELSSERRHIMLIGLSEREEKSMFRCICLTNVLAALLSSLASVIFLEFAVHRLVKESFGGTSSFAISYWPLLALAVCGIAFYLMSFLPYGAKSK